jgi:hypothetical protein
MVIQQFRAASQVLKASQAFAKKRNEPHPSVNCPILQHSAFRIQHLHIIKWQLHKNGRNWQTGYTITPEGLANGVCFQFAPLKRPCRRP